MRTGNNFKKTQYYGEGFPNEYVNMILNNYHYYELYDSEKEYIVGIFRTDYGHGLLNYSFAKVLINNIEYIIVEEQISGIEQNILSEYCECNHCSKHFLNPLKYITFQCYVGCLKSPFPSQGNIDIARRNYKKS